MKHWCYPTLNCELLKEKIASVHSEPGAWLLKELDKLNQ